MKQEEKPMWIEREDYCPNCNSQKALMLFDKYNSITNYPMLLDQNRTDIFNVNEYSKQYNYLQCNRCGTKFFIDWSTGLPRAMHPRHFKTFMNNFKMMKMV